MLDPLLPYPSNLWCWCCERHAMLDLRARSQQLKRQRKKDVCSKGGRRHDKEEGAAMTWAKINREPFAWMDLWSNTICEFWSHQSSLQERQFLVQHQQISPVSSCDYCLVENCKGEKTWMQSGQLWTEENSENKQTKSLWTCRCQHKSKRLISLFS